MFKASFSYFVKLKGATLQVHVTLTALCYDMKDWKWLIDNADEQGDDGQPM